MRTLSVALFFAAPLVLLQNKPVLLVSALTIHTALDVDLGARM